MPQNNYCIHCGAPLSPGDKFCQECGQPVGQRADEPTPEPQQPTMPRTCPVCGAPLQEGQHFCISCGAQVDEAPTAPQPASAASHTVEATTVAPRPAQAANPTPAVQMTSPTAAPTARAARKEPNSRTIITVCVGVIAASAVAVAVVLALTGGLGSSKGTDDAQQASSQPVAQQEDSEPSDQSASSSSSTTTSTDSTTAQQDAAQADAQFHTTLQGYYQALPGYSDSIASVASTFNNSYLTADLSTRQANYTAASSLLSEIESQRSALASLAVPSGSAWVTQYQQVIQCYDYSATRLQCMVDAWAIDVRYDDPAAYKDEILAPIEAGNGANHHNQAKQDYEALYPQISL